MLAMNAQHGLHPHNRRFYFDASKQSFEPIYYDGLASFGSSIIWEKVRQQELIKLAGHWIGRNRKANQSFKR